MEHTKNKYGIVETLRITNNYEFNYSSKHLYTTINIEPSIYISDDNLLTMFFLEVY